MKHRLLPAALGLAAMALSTSCKPKPKLETTAAEPAAETPAATPGSPAASAATADQPAGNRPGGGAGNFQQRAAERMQQMKTELGLSDDQATKISAVFDSQFGALRQQMGNNSISREDRRAAFEKARTAANAQIDQILTPEQKPKWAALQQKMEQERNQRRQQGGGQRNNGN